MLDIFCDFYCSFGKGIEVEGFIFSFFVRREGVRMGRVGVGSWRFVLNFVFEFFCLERFLGVGEVRRGFWDGVFVIWFGCWFLSGLIYFSVSMLGEVV